MSQNFSELRSAPRYRCWAARGSSRQHQTGTVVTSGAAFQQLRGTWTWRAGEKAETWLKNGGWFTSKTIAKLWKHAGWSCYIYTLSIYIYIYVYMVYDIYIHIMYVCMYVCIYNIYVICIVQKWDNQHRWCQTVAAVGSFITIGTSTLSLWPRSVWSL